MIESQVHAYVIFNDKIEFKTFPLRDLKFNEAGLYYEYNYGMGALHLSVINSPQEAFERQLKDNVLWAKERMKWAVEYNEREVPKLKDIINSNGYLRLQSTLEKFKRIRNEALEPA